MIYPLAPLVPFIFPTHTALCSGWKMQPPSPGASFLSRAWGGAYVLSTWPARVGLGAREDERPSGPPGWGCVWGDRFPCSQPRPGLNFPEGDGGRESDPQENWDLVIKPNCKFS